MSIKGLTTKNTKNTRELDFLDPACGCGNFLVLACRELRKLEREAHLRALRALRGKFSGAQNGGPDGQGNA